MAGNQALGKEQRSVGRQRKTGTSRLTGNCTFSVVSVLKADRETRKDRNLLLPNGTSCSLCSPYNKISLADKQHTPCSEAMTLLIKLNKDKNPFWSCRETGNLTLKLLLPQ